MRESRPTLNELAALAQRQSALRGDLLARQAALAHEVSTAGMRPFVRLGRLARVAASVAILVAPATLVSACTPVPDGRDMHTECERTQIISNARQIIHAL